MECDRLEHVEEFYDHLDKLPVFSLNEALSRANCPTKGVYFFFEPFEFRESENEKLRVVRIGTHGLKVGSKTKLRQRLVQHRGTLKNRGGNHRGSIFRSLIGQALQTREGKSVQSWGQRQSIAKKYRHQELAYEQAVSAYLSQMTLACLEILDEPGAENRRGLIERNAIALLSNARSKPINPSSSSWLGHYSDREKVAASGLWNSNHVLEDYDPQFIEVLERLVDNQVAAKVHS